MNKTDKDISKIDEEDSWTNEGQYEEVSILRYEKVFGENYISAGGHNTTMKMIDCITLDDSLTRVLDIGSGLGGAAFHLASTYKCAVIGVDLAPTMVHIANRKASEAHIKDVNFIIGDAAVVDLGVEKYDLVWSRDTLLHVKDKISLFKRVSKLLRSGGTFIIADYSQASMNDEDIGEEFKMYREKSGYNLLTPEAYGKLVEDAGFIDVNARDETEYFFSTLQKEKDDTMAKKEEFLNDFSVEDFDYLMQRWEKKIRMCTEGDMKWTIITAKNP